MEVNHINIFLQPLTDVRANAGTKGRLMAFVNKEAKLKPLINNPKIRTNKSVVPIETIFKTIAEKSATSVKEVSQALENVLKNESFVTQLEKITSEDFKKLTIVEMAKFKDTFTKLFQAQFKNILK